MKKGQKHTEEAKEKNRQAHIGKILSEETKRKMRLVAKGFQGVHTIESRKKMSKTKKKLYSEGKIKVWNYLDGRSKRKQLNRPCKNINGKSIQLSHIVWCSQPGNLPFIPYGCLIHHIDLNLFNNNSENLLLLNRSIHNYIHNNISKMLLEVN